MAAEYSDSLERRIAPFAWKYDFTKEDLRCIIQVAAGKTNLEIAGEFRCTEDAIVARVSKILQRLNANNRTQIAAKFLCEVFILPNCPEGVTDFCVFCGLCERKVRK